jgi:hypothetical protein
MADHNSGTEPQQRENVMRTLLFVFSIICCYQPNGVAQANQPQPQTNHQTLDTLSHIAAGLPPVSLIMVEVRNLGRLQGQLLAAQNDSLFISIGQSRSGIPHAAIQALWTRGRATKTGAIVGGTLGAIGVGAYVSVLCAFGLSEDGVSGNEDQVWGCALVGGIAGAAGGGLLGGVIGAAIPKWHHRYRASALSSDLQRIQPEAPANAPVSPQDYGSLHLLFGYAQSEEPGASTGSFGGRVNLFARINRYLAIGPELGYYKLGSSQFADFEGNTYTVENNVWHANGMFRFASSHGKWRPFAAVGLGYYHGQKSYVAGSLGGGFDLQLGDTPFVLTAEARWHQNLQNLSGPSPEFVTFMAGMARAW